MIALLAAGFVLGISVAAPIGPVGAAVIREGLERGALAAFLIGLGAASVDFLYLGLVYAGVAPLLLRLPWLTTGFYALGALLLGQMAYGSLKRAWEGGLPAPAGGQGRGYLYGFGITLFNPATIVSWLGLGGAFASTWLVGVSWSRGISVLLAVAAGSAAWFGFLAGTVGLVRRVAGQRPWIFRLVNLAAGIVLSGFTVTFVLKLMGR